MYSSTDYVFIDTTLYRILVISLLSYVSCRVNGHKINSKIGSDCGTWTLHSQHCEGVLCSISKLAC